MMELSNKHHHSPGFTLIELLFVLLVVSIISFISIPIVHKAYIENQTNNFFMLLDSDILYIQNQALSNESYSIFFEQDHYIVMRNRRTEYVRTYPEHIRFRNVSTNSILFNNAGTMMDPTTFLFYDDEDQLYRVIFPLGKGRHYIEKN